MNPHCVADAAGADASPADASPATVPHASLDHLPQVPEFDLPMLDDFPPLEESGFDEHRLMMNIVPPPIMLASVSEPTTMVDGNAASVFSELTTAAAPSMPLVPPVQPPDASPLLDSATYLPLDSEAFRPLHPDAHLRLDPNAVSTLDLDTFAPLEPYGLVALSFPIGTAPAPVTASAPESTTAVDNKAVSFDVRSISTARSRRPSV